MSSVIDRGEAVAREILKRRGLASLDHAFIRAALVEAFSRGAMWGIERTQHAVAITHARYKTEIERDAP